MTRQPMSSQPGTRSGVDGGIISDWFYDRHAWWTQQANLQRLEWNMMQSCVVCMHGMVRKDLAQTSRSRPCTRPCRTLPEVGGTHCSRATCVRKHGAEVIPPHVPGDGQSIVIGRPLARWGSMSQCKLGTPERERERERAEKEREIYIYIKRDI